MDNYAVCRYQGFNDSYCSAQPWKAYGPDTASMHLTHEILSFFSRLFSHARRRSNR